MNGIVLVNKPAGLTSHDVVDRARSIFNMRKIGHAGTLDPLATGLLILLLGKATKRSVHFMGFDKAYTATLILGVRTNTADTQGEVIEQKPFDHITFEKVEEVLENFRGSIEQVPPMFSAIKHKGKKLYELARKGIEVKRVPRNICIHLLKVEHFDLPHLKIYVECSKGTYLRQLAEDIGKDLGCGACICQIERTKIGDFDLKESCTLEELNESHIRDWQG